MDNNPALGIGNLRYSDLNDYSGLEKLSSTFDDFLRTNDEALFARCDA